MAQRQLPGGGFVSEGGTARQVQLPGGGFLGEPAGAASYAVDVSESVSAADAVSASVIAATVSISESASATDALACAAVLVAAVFETRSASDTMVGGSFGIPQPFVTRPRRGPRLLLTDDLPLQLSTQIGAFAEAVALAQRYGDLRRTRFKLIRMTSTKYIAAGHPMKSITRAFTGNLQTKAFDTFVESVGGVTYQVVEFAAPVPIGTDCFASGEGKLNATTGALIENPADIMADLLLIANRTDPWFGQLRAEASAASITLAGSFDTVEPIRTALDRVIDSCGGIWCPGMSRLYPAPFEGFRIDLDQFNAHDLVVSASITDTGDIARVAFDYDDAEGKNQSFIQLEASPDRYGGKVIDVALPMVRSAGTAEAIGRRVLGWYAGERCGVSLNTDAGEFVRPGTWALLSGHPQWPFDDDPMLMITTALRSRTLNTARVTAEALLSTPTITLTKHSLGSDSIGTGGIEVEVRNGFATFTLLDNDDKPLVGAYVSLDGAAPKKTDGQGQVVFTTTAGIHELAVEAAGFVPYTIGVTL